MAIYEDPLWREKEREWEKEDQAHQKELILLSNQRDIELKRLDVRVVGKWASINNCLNSLLSYGPKCLVICWVGVLALWRRPIPKIFERILQS